MAKRSSLDKNAWPTYRRLLGYSLPHWKVMVIAFVATAILAGVDTAFAALIKPLLDRAFVEQNPNYIRWIDRKSVVSGKRVSVRVDLVGGSIIKKQNQLHTT